jgi:hypothetical protein
MHLCFSVPQIRANHETQLTPKWEVKLIIWFRDSLLVPAGEVLVSFQSLSPFYLCLLRTGDEPPKRLVDFVQKLSLFVT